MKKTTLPARIAGFVVFSVFVGVAMAAHAAMPILDANGQAVRYPSYITEYDGQLYFRGTPADGSANAELWRSDGFTAELVADINPGPINGSSPSSLAVYNNKLYFGATGPTGASRLWQYDSATDVASLAPGSAANASVPEEMIAYGGNLYYRATRFSDVGTELWKFDGANQTPIDIYPGPGSSGPQHFIQHDGLLYFSACGTPGQGSELWGYNGVSPYYEAARINPGNGSSPEDFAVFQNSLYFRAYDGVHGAELWRFNDTASLAADILPGGQYSSGNPGNLATFGNKLYFSANDGIHGYELWSFDGTTAQMVTEINPTPDPLNGDTFLMDSSPMDLTEFNGLLYFSANDGVHGRELWASDGETAWMVEDINPGQYGSDVSELTVFNDRLFFAADQLYTPSQGSAAPTVWMMAAPEPVFVAGDVDKNGRVEIFDVAVLQTKYGMTSGAIWADGDFDGNGTVDIFDVALMQVNYGYGVASSPAPVPEPSTFVLGVVAAICVTIGWWRRRG